MRIAGIWVVGVVSLLCAVSAQAAFNIVPEPQHLTPGQGVFDLRQGERIEAPADARAQWIAGFLRDHVSAQTGVELKVVKAPDPGAIELRINPAIHGSEAYRLDVTPQRVTIAAASNRGLFWGVETLRQLLSVKPGAPPAIPAVRIDDAPRYPWRGVMLDVSRHFFPVSFVKKQIALMSYYKFDVFHWHLTDDQGWRIQIKRYPKLTSVGAWRTGFDGKRYGGFYTQQEIREVVKYASERNVMVVPEIEMPGHTSAAIAAYPELACNNEPIEPPTSWGVLRNVDCVGKNSTFTFLDNVLDEVIQLFPSPYVHIGGDEVPPGVWDDCTACSRLAKTHGFKDDEQGLHSYFVSRIQKYLASKGKTMIGWDEILEGGVSPDAIVEVWHGPAFAMKAMANGNRVIVAWPFYLDKLTDNMTMEDLYRNDPFSNPGFARYPGKLLGGEAALWSEHATPLDGAARLYPRLLAISEHLWNPAAHDWSDFLPRARAQEAWLASQHVPFGSENKDLVSYRLRFVPTYRRWRIRAERGFNNLRLHYTLDGSQPKAASLSFGDVLDLYHPATVTVAPFRGDVQYQASETFQFVSDLALGDPVTSVVRPVRGTASQLTDGILGSNDPPYNAPSGWVVWPSSGMDVTVNLGKVESVHSIEVGFFQGAGYGAAVPLTVSFEVSTDGSQWSTLQTAQPSVSYADSGIMGTHNVQYTLPEPQNARYIRVIAKESDPGRTHVFADELIVR